MNIAVLLTCFNRKLKTKECLSSFINIIKKYPEYNFDIYLVDDHSTDGTAEMIKETFPSVNLISGNGSLFWAGGMRLAWKIALDSSQIYDGFLLINDDVCFIDTFWDIICETDKYVELHYGMRGIYTLSTADKDTGNISYGGHCLRKKLFKHSYYQVYPSDQPQECELTNANILFVSSNVVKSIGILDTHYTHFLADFDYSLTAKQNGFPVFVSPGIGGYCKNDHYEDPLSPDLFIKKRIKNLYGIKGLALNEYLYYLRKHFYFKAPYAFVVLWLRTLFPKIIPEK